MQEIADGMFVVATHLIAFICGGLACVSWLICSASHYDDLEEVHEQHSASACTTEDDAAAATDRAPERAI